MDHDLKKKGISVVRWSLLDKVGSQVLLLLSTLVLARLLGPKDYGLVGMLYIFLNISSLFIDSGMGAGLIRKQNLSELDCNTFFYFNISVAAILYTIIFVSAPFISIFYEEPLVTPILRVLGLTLIINSFSLIQKELLIKELNLKFVTRSSLIASFFATIITVFCAIKGYGVWSLVIMQITQSLIAVCLMWRFSAWRPQILFSFDSLKEFYSYGMGLFLSSFVDIIFKNIYQPLIGKLFSTSYAGYYTQAKKIYEIPVLTLSSLVDSVSFPILVKYQDNMERLSDSYRKIFLLLIYISLPLAILLFVLADDLIFVMLGKVWMFSAELLKILSFSAIFIVLETINRSLFKIQGRTRLIFKMEVIKKAIILLTIFITYRYGIKALMYGIVFNSISSYLINQFFTTIPVRDYKKIALIAFNSLLMGIVVYVIAHSVSNPYFSLLLSGPVGTGIYIALSYLMKFNEPKWLLSIVLPEKRIK